MDRLCDAQLTTILDGLPVGVMLRAADRTLLHINPAGRRFLERLGIDVAHVHASPTAMLDHVEVIDERGRPCVPEDLPVVSALRDASSRDATLGYALPGGGYAWYAVRAAPVALADGSAGTVVTLDDVTDRRALEEELRDMATRDPLTGVANRRALTERLRDAQRGRRRGDGEIGLVYLDLDRFKAINDGHGHDLGDRVLVETAARLVDATRSDDLVCRMGGDEFVVLCAPIDGPEALWELAERLEAMPPVTVSTAGPPIGATASVGAVLVGPQEDLDSALRRADAAMYRAKREKACARGGTAI